MRVTRRDFCFQVATAAPLSALPLTTHPLRKQPTGDSEQQQLAPRLIVSCNLYSFNRALTTGVMALPEVMEYCASIGFDAVDPTGYYFAGYPTPPSDEAIYRIKHRAFRLGLDIGGTGMTRC